MTAEAFTGYVCVHDINLYFDVRGAGEPLLLLHGFTGSSADWQYAGREALASRFESIALDARGHGRSTNPLGVITHRQCALDVLAFLDERGISRCRAIGMSFGGNTLLHVATLAPERVSAMVLVSATPYFPEQARAIMASVEVTDHPPEEWDSMRQRHQRGDEQIRALWEQQHAFKDSYDDMSFTPPQLSRITAATLIVYGDRDPLYPVEMGVSLHRAIPNSALCVVPNAGHGPIFLERAEPFTRTCLDFFASAG
jgi:pimeloyl-ACP methyl ester carboxylesterase